LWYLPPVIDDGHYETFLEHEMARKLSRREFIKAAGISAAATAVLTGCGPDSRYVVREPYVRMPEYTYNGQSTYYATTCRECPAGCGIMVRTEQGRALKVEGNPNHPVNLGKTCSRAQAAPQGLYNPDRIQYPLKQARGSNQSYSKLSWDDAITTIKDILQSIPPGQIAFLMGMVPDHLFDLVSELCQALGAPAPMRYGAYALYDARLTLVKATQKVFSTPALPYFDLANADMTFSFGANFLETYLSPMAYSRGYAEMRRGKSGHRGYLVQFEPRLSQTAGSADEWVAIAPGTQGLVALAIGRLIAEIRGQGIPQAFQGVDIAAIASAADVSAADLQRLANMFSTASHPLAIPGSSVFGYSNGVEATQAVLALNALVSNLGRAGGVFISPQNPVHGDLPWQPNSIVDISGLIDQMRLGQVKALFIHGINTIFELPGGLDFAGALAKVPQVISFASFPDETSQQADYIFPDHTALESWGYQKVSPIADRMVITGSQPVVTPFYDTRATADVLLAAIQAIGGDLANALPYTDEVQYIQAAVADLVGQPGFFNASEIYSFMSQFQQYGGWWQPEPNLSVPDGAKALNQPIANASSAFDGTGDYFLLPFLSPILGDGSGANRPWLQETPDPMTTVIWNSWLEINPTSADVLGLDDDDVVRVISPIWEIEAVVYRYPAIRVDTISIPFGQGHTVYGRYAEGRGTNPHQVTSLVYNGAGDMAFGATRVFIEKTGRKRPLSRLESKLGVYGLGFET
jgi:anaerobic selenocysteine-containing dehydrogenase